jgi:D-xylose transport system permease protein
MAEPSSLSPASSSSEAPAGRRAGIGDALRALELDTRMVGMIGALAVVWIGFDILTGGAFLTPRNLWNLSVQTASVAVMATGMVLVIVTRNIDLSVGSILGFTGMVVGVLQARVLPEIWGFDNPLTWVVAVLAAIAVGGAVGALQGAVIAYLGVSSFIVTLGGLLVWRGAAWWVTTGQTVAPMDGLFKRLGGGFDGAIGALQGAIIAYQRVPSFIVTLGGYLVWRGAAWWVASGRTVAPMDQTFQLMGGGPAGSIGLWPSWIVAAIACVAIVTMIYFGRRQRQRFNFPQRPVWAEGVLAGLGCAIVVAAVWVANSYPWPVRIAQRYAEQNGIPIPEGGLMIPHGIAIPVLICVGVGVVMTFVATRTRFGRYVFAMGGNPEAAELAGIRTRWVTVKIFTLMGALVGISAAISVARLNAATNALGTLDELYVIAAAVIGGTSLSGGVGTIAGAMLGALVMQSLQSGMVLIGIDSPLQSIVVGVVLVFAVWLDTLYRRRAG